MQDLHKDLVGERRGKRIPLQSRRLTLLLERCELAGCDPCSVLCAAFETYDTPTSLRIWSMPHPPQTWLASQAAITCYLEWLELRQETLWGDHSHRMPYENLRGEIADSEHRLSMLLHGPAPAEEVIEIAAETGLVRPIWLACRFPRGLPRELLLLLSDQDRAELARLQEHFLTPAGCDALAQLQKGLQ